MAHSINLTAEHQVLFVEALVRSLDIKSRDVIRDPAKADLTRQQYQDAAEKFLNTIRINMPSKNIFVWMSDQIQHTPGLRDSELGHRVQDICDVARRNQYQAYIQYSELPNNFEQLFSVQ
jgi:hypothetical protein